MDRRKFVTLAGIGGVVGAFSTQLLVKLPLIGVQPAQASAAQAETIKNLQAAYNGETNAHVRYLAFAKQADQEGYKQVAILFKAAATSEAIHAANHGAVLREMGATPMAKIETPTVNTTKANLEAAITGETYERVKMYPEFIKQAKEADENAAIKTFTYAQEAEAEHAKYYSEALANLTNWKEAKLGFYVCPECGYTTSSLDFENCPECETAKALFIKFS
jgi:rubrerythrin